MIRKLTKNEKSRKISGDKKMALEEIRGGLNNLPDELHDLLCSTWCEKYCGEQAGSDGKMWVGNRDIR